MVSFQVGDVRAASHETCVQRGADAHNISSCEIAGLIRRTSRLRDPLVRL